MISMNIHIVIWVIIVKHQIGFGYFFFFILVKDTLTVFIYKFFALLWFLTWN